MGWARLPPDILETVLIHTNLSDLGECAVVCKAWNAVFQGTRYWLLYVPPAETAYNFQKSNSTES